VLYQLILIVVLFFLLSFRFYGRFLARRFHTDDVSPTPACEINDGVDYVPAKATLLLGQHFSAIAAAGPIVGPILACLWFGWMPALVWVVLGAVFIGGVHDFGSLTASLKHKAASIGEIVKIYMPGAHKFFLIFVWLALVYVIIAFTDITAHTFTTTVADEAFGPAVAGSSFLYLVASVAMGVVLTKFKMNLRLATAIFLPLVLGIIWAGSHLPQALLARLAQISVKQWDGIILAYCLAASLMPVWLLLQPRGYLGGWFLYLVVLIGLIGGVFGGFSIEYPAFNLTGLRSADNAKLIFPVLFITIACGACSGFHGIVSSGTTSKQICKYKDSLPIGYGAMLLEGLVAVLAMATVMMLPKGSEVLKSDPNLIYAQGIARYLGLLKVGYQTALMFALLAFSTFVYDTLDVCTRLARYIFQELTGWKSKTGMVLSALISLLVPFLFLMFSKEKGYLAAWPIFGTSNQLLASLTLLAISVWLIETGQNALFTTLPMLFMMTMTTWSLWDMVTPLLRALPGMGTTTVGTDTLISGVCGTVLLVLSLMLLSETIKSLWATRKQ
jgi:carbon starvation protein